MFVCNSPNGKYTICIFKQSIKNYFHVGVNFLPQKTIDKYEYLCTQTYHSLDLIVSNLWVFLLSIAEMKCLCRHRYSVQHVCISKIVATFHICVLCLLILFCFLH